MKKNQLSFFLVSLSILFLCDSSAFSAAASDSFTLTIAHVNDSHGHLDAQPQKFTIGGKEVTLNAGGSPSLVAAVNKLRQDSDNFLFLVAGDVFQGTLYFTKYAGLADLWFLNKAGADAFVVGNHEFDRGPETLARFIQGARFMVLGANLNTRNEPKLNGLMRPSMIKKMGDHEVAIVGLTTPETPHISSGAGQVEFLDETKTLKKIMAELSEKGINKVIVLSHLGFENDIKLAQNVAGIDIIVGAHSHTLLGNFQAIGVKSVGPSPRVVKNKGGKTLIVQAGDNLRVLGDLTVTFTTDGVVKDYTSSPKLLVEKNAQLTKLASAKQLVCFEMVDEDIPSKIHLAALDKPLKQFKETPVATALEDLKRGENTGPGTIVTDALLAKTKQSGAQIALYNSSGIRSDISKGSVTVGEVYDMLPFGNKLVTFKLSGEDLKQTLGNVVQRNLAQKRKPPYFYVSGLRVLIDPNKPQGQIFTEFKYRDAAGQWQDVKNDSPYTIASIDFIASGASGFGHLKKSLKDRKDTGLVDAEIVIDYMKKMKVLKNPIP